MVGTLCALQCPDKSAVPWPAVRIILHSIRHTGLCLTPHPRASCGGRNNLRMIICTLHSLS